jgi:hypothetical protein
MLPMLKGLAEPQHGKSISATPNLNSDQNSDGLYYQYDQPPHNPRGIWPVTGPIAAFQVLHRLKISNIVCPSTH